MSALPKRFTAMTNVLVDRLLCYLPRAIPWGGAPVKHYGANSGEVPSSLLGTYGKEGRCQSLLPVTSIVAWWTVAVCQGGDG